MNRRWVIPDIHGCYKTLKTLFEYQIKPTREDEIYFLGDYIDRGPDSKGVIDYIRQMEADGYKVSCLRGNHEDYCVRAVESELKRKSFLGIKPKNKVKAEWEKHGGIETQESFGITNLKYFPKDYLEWMQKLPYYLELDDYILVHAGLNFDISNPFDDKISMIWIRDYRVVPAKINNKTIIHGHVPVSLEFMDMMLKNNSHHFIDLDNAVYMSNRPGFGNLVALELNSKELKVQSNMDL